MLKKILIGLGILFVLFIAVLVGLFFFGMAKINSPATADFVKKEIQNYTGAEVRFSEHTISLSELTLKNLTIPNPKAAEGENILSVENVRVTYKLTSIFSGAVMVPEISITKPSIRLRQDKEGGLILPIDLAQIKTKLSEARKTQTQPAPDANVPINAPDIKVIGAEVEVFADDGSLLFKAENANITAAFSQTLTDRNATGSLTSKLVTIMPAIKATDIQSPIKFEKDVFSLTDIVGKLYSGSLKASADLDTKPSPMTFQVRAALASVDMSGLMTGVGSDPQTLLGKLQLDFKGSGNLDAPKELLGEGTLQITEVQVPKLQNLKVLGSVLGISALKEGKFDGVDSAFKIAGQKVSLEPLHVKSENLNINMIGPVGFDKNVDLKGGVQLDANAVKMLVTLAGIKTLEGGQTIPITVTGPVNDPKISLDGQSLDNVLAVLDPAKILAAPGQLIEGLFNKPKNDSPSPTTDGTAAPEQKKPGVLDVFNPFKSKPKAEPAPAPAPAPTPAPTPAQP